jgi:hypothetical protein
LNAIDAADPELIDPHPIPDIVHMSRKLKMCLQVEFEIKKTVKLKFLGKRGRAEFTSRFYASI